ncbi:MAG: ribokinase [Anaerolineales bacterium]|nr:ribokinase [Anaerolineales bacterium]
MTDAEYREEPILVIGSAGIDIVGRAMGGLRPGTSNPSHVRTSAGGAARNVAENLARLGLEVNLVTAIGDDTTGHWLLEQAEDVGINVEHALMVSEDPTGAYLAFLDHHGTLHLGMDDMRVIQNITPEYLKERRQLFTDAQAIFLDANLPKKSLATAISLAKRANIPIAADPTSINLAPNFTDHLEDLWLITPNEAEAEVLCTHPVPHEDPGQVVDAARHLVSEGVEVVIITMAEFGLGYATHHGSGHVPAIKTEIIDPTGAGDALTAAVIFALVNEIPIDEAVLLGLSAASLTLRTSGTVVPNLSLELLYDQL